MAGSRPLGGAPTRFTGGFTTIVSGIQPSRLVMWLWLRPRSIAAAAVSARMCRRSLHSNIFDIARP